MTKLYCGMDLHSSNTYSGIMDEHMNRIKKRRLPNELYKILMFLEPYRDQLQGIVVESTYNWYWLVDGLMSEGYHVHLANPAANIQYEGLKYSDDKSSAFWLARLLLLGILKEGYIYPKEERPIRDLLRRRLFFMKHSTSNFLSLQSMIMNTTSRKVSYRDLVELKMSGLQHLLQNSTSFMNARLALNTVEVLKAHIVAIEKEVRNALILRKPFHLLHTIPGIGDILSMTIMLEIGHMDRFKTQRNFCSYARCVPSKRVSNKKKTGEGNKKNGNRYLSWAFAEASHHAQKNYDIPRKYFQKKTSRTNKMVAYRALSNKIAKATYYVLKDEIPFDMNKLFG